MSGTDGKKAAQRVWGATPAGWQFGGGATAGTPEYFDLVYRRRSTYEQPWLGRLVPFEGMRGRRVLEVGCGAGYDAYDFVRNGANYTGIDITPENIQRTRNHLALKGFQADIREADAECLPFPSESFDTCYSNGVLHHVPDIAKALDEAYRVLVPGGDLFLVLYHRYSAYYWLTLYAWGWWVRGDRKRYRGFAERLRHIELTTSDAIPLVNVYSRGDVVRLLVAAGFASSRIDVRKLVHEDLPAGTRWPLRHVPQRVLDVFGRWVGWYVIAHARKPVSA